VITLSNNTGDSIEIEYPEWGYISSAHLAIEPIKTSVGWDVWNNGIATDYRTCKIERSIFDEQDGVDLDTFLIANRRVPLSMDIGTNSNFYPFMPDKGDSGIFVVHVIDRKFGQFDQFNQFAKEWELLMTYAPDYELPAVTNQANFQIGTVDGLMYPQAGIDSSRIYGVNTGISYGGQPYSVDIRRNIHETNFTQRCNTGLAAELLYFLTGATGRHQDITIIAPDNYYLFDPANSASGTYTCKLIQNIIECRQINYEEFEISLSFWMKSKS
jgi:hypothetical protein